MTRKDYILIADILNLFDFLTLEHPEDFRGSDWLACQFSDMLAKDNGRFDRERFIAAATY